MVNAQQVTRNRQVTVIIAALLVLFLSGLLDYGIDSLRQLARESFQVTPYLGSVIAANLLTALMLLALSWFVLRLGQPLRIAGGALLLFGLPVVFYPLLFFQAELGVPPAVSWLLAPASMRVGLSSAFIAMLGLFLLFRPS